MIAVYKPHVLINQDQGAQDLLHLTGYFNTLSAGLRHELEKKSFCLVASENFILNSPELLKTNYHTPALDSWPGISI